MKRFLIYTAALTATVMLGAPAMAQTARTPGNSALPPASPPNAMVGPEAGSAAALPHAGSAELSAMDQNFVKKAAEGGIAEVQLAQMVQEKTQSDQVKQFAQQMIDDHTPNNQKLVTLATALGVTPPSEPNAMQQKMAARLEGMSGAKLDRAYVRGQIHDHETMLKLFQTEASNGGNPQLKAFAAETVPVVQQHLEHAEHLQKAGV